MTYSQYAPYFYPLDIAIGLGGDGTNEWNANGTIVDTDIGSYSYTDQVLDATGFIRTSGDKGYGTIISTGTVTVNGAALQVRNTYTLGQNDAFIIINTEVANLSGADVSNLRVWVGTRDDWVGTDDGPVKQRGNLVNDAFQVLSNAADRALALLISADSGAATPAVLFYTTAPNATTVVDSCCSFSNAYMQDPSASPIEVSPGSDGSYAMYVRMPDLANNESSEFTWYYAAGDIAEINNIIADVSAASSAVSNVTYTSADLGATADNDGTGYYVVVARDATAPTETQIKAGVDYGGVTVVDSGSAGITGGVEHTFNMTGLSAGIDYDVYFVAEDSVPAFSAVVKTQFSTLAYTAPVVSSTAAASAITGISASSGGTVDSDGSGGVHPVTARGVCWSTSSNPSTADSCTVDGSGTGSFISSITGLLPSTTYNVRAYGTNSIDTGYGPQQSFTTAADDGDGVPLAVENAGPNGGDGNGDGTPDSGQSNVISLLDDSGLSYMTMEVSGGCAVAESVAAVALPVEDPRGFTYPFDLLEFSLPCETATVTVYYHGVEELPKYKYRKYGPTPPGAATSRWYTLPGASFGTAIVDGATVATVTFNLADNQLGDDTGDDGVIVDQGGPGLPPSLPIPVLPVGLLVLLSGFLGLLGLRAIKKRV